MSVTNEITQNIITNKLTDNIMMNFCKKVDEIQEKYIETFIVFENKLKNKFTGTKKKTKKYFFQFFSLCFFP